MKTAQNTAFNTYTLIPITSLSNREGKDWLQGTIATNNANRLNQTREFQDLVI